jgi:hypothetical protein
MQRATCQVVLNAPNDLPLGKRVRERKNERKKRQRREIRRILHKLQSSRLAAKFTARPLVNDILPDQLAAGVKCKTLQMRA